MPPQKFQKTLLCFMKIFNFLHVVPLKFSKTLYILKIICTFLYVALKILFLYSGPPKEKFLGPPLLGILIPLYTLLHVVIKKYRAETSVHLVALFSNC
jgi:hypothetical protein